MARGGRTIADTISRFTKTDGQNPLASLRVIDDVNLPLSQRKTGSAPGSFSTAVNRLGDTAAETLDSSLRGRDAALAIGRIARTEDVRDMAAQDDAAADVEGSLNMAWP